MNQTDTRALPAVLSAIVILIAAPAASSFERSKTCRWPDDYHPDAPSSAPVCESGEVPQEFYWPTKEVEYLIHREGCCGFVDEEGTITSELEDAIVASFETWNAPECSDFRFVYGGLTDVDRHDPDDELNVVTWREPWPHSGSAYALTLVTTLPDGEIIDVDLELNSDLHRFTVDEDSDAAVVDVRNTVTHEAGHFLGLEHTPVEAATMYWRAPLGETSKRDLHEDDIEGLCAIYPLGQPPVGSEPEDPPDESQGCCTSTAPPAHGKAALLVSLVLVGLVWARRRRSKSGGNAP